MKVKELIETLLKFEQEKEIKVIAVDACCGDKWAEDITIIKHYKEFGDYPPNGLINDEEQDCYILGS